MNPWIHYAIRFVTPTPQLPLCRHEKKRGRGTKREKEDIEIPLEKKKKFTIQEKGKKKGTESRLDSADHRFVYCPR